MKRDYARLTEPMVRENGKLRIASWEEALSLAAEGFARARATRLLSRVLVIDTDVCVDVEPVVTLEVPMPVTVTAAASE